MTITSITFAIFFTLVFAAWYGTPLAQRWVVMVVASVGFCLLAAPATLVVLAVGSVLGFVAGLASDRVHGPGARRACVGGSVTLLVALLAAARGLSVRGTIAGLAGMGAGDGGGLAPFMIVGASFFTLKIIAYVLDTFAGRIEPERSLWRFIAFAATFLELPAGPIDRAQRLLPQLIRPQRFSLPVAASGTRLVLWGLFKKLVVADRLAPFVAYVYDDPTGKLGISLALGTTLFAFQILADFSGYSDIAVGLGRCLGLELAQNFDAPYSARSIGDFWRRWHISFSTWLRDYIFLPVNYRVLRMLDGQALLCLKEEYWGYAAGVVVTMSLGGLWHGSGWQFIAWGMLLALYMITSVFTRKARARLVRALGLKGRPGLHHSLQVITTFALVAVAWVFFRATSLSEAAYVLRHLGSGLAGYAALAWRVLVLRSPESGLAAPWRLGQPALNVLVAGAFLAGMVGVEHLRSKPHSEEVWFRVPRSVQFAACLTLALLIVMFRSFSRQEFVYAGF